MYREQHPISNLQLQKILYYVQKAFLQSGGIAFDDDIEAWQFGQLSLRYIINIVDLVQCRSE